MKKLIKLFLLFGCVFSNIEAETIHHTFHFHLDDFKIEKQRNDSSIITTKKEAVLWTSLSEPGLPILSRNVAISGNEKINNFSLEYSKNLIASDIKLATTQPSYPTNYDTKDIKLIFNKYQPNVYPDTICRLARTTNIGGIDVANFQISPFVFDAKSNNLYFIDSLKIAIDIDTSTRKKSPRLISSDEYDALELIVDNKDVLRSIETNNSLTHIVGDIEYVIITVDSLKEAFRPLAEWKRKKGVQSKIFTIEEINRQYTGKDQQIRIKSCLTDLWENNGLRFALLGGDVELVPTQKCIASTAASPYFEGTTEYNMPTDLYYSSLIDLDWNPNGDNKVGEMKIDKITITPTLYVTRAPVRNTYETEVFVNRTLEYEKDPHFYYELFQAGTPIDTHKEYGAYGEEYADLIFENAIVGQIRIGRTKLFDSSPYVTDILNSVSFTNELNKGYAYVEVFSHGNETNFCGVHPKSYFFNISDAANFTNSGHTLFTTTACHTNAFDLPETPSKSNPCMSESLFRNPNSEIIGYLGSSREGFSKLPASLENSYAFEYSFYKRMLHPNLKPYDKNFGALVAFMKMELTPLAYDNYIYRWLMYSINAIGDPETPIFNTYPITFSNASAEYNNDGLLVVSTGVEGTRVCVSSANSDNLMSFYYKDYVSDVSLDTDFGIFDVWITKQNYIPKHFSVTKFRQTIDMDSSIIDIPEPTAPRILSIYPNPATDNVTVKYKPFSNSETVMLSLNPINGGNAMLFDISGTDGEATISVSGIQNGIYLLNIRENGIWSSNPQKLIVQ